MSIWQWPEAVVSDVAHDGDTFRANVDMGRAIFWQNGSVRLARINAPELGKPGGSEARDYLRSLLPVGTSISLTSVGYDKYGDRVDAEVVRKSDKLNINDEMVRSGHAIYQKY